MHLVDLLIGVLFPFKKLEPPPPYCEIASYTTDTDIDIEHVHMHVDTT